MSIIFKEPVACKKCITHYHTLEPMDKGLILTHPHGVISGGRKRNIGTVVQRTWDVTRFFEKHFDKKHNWMGLCKMALDNHDSCGFDYLFIDVPDTKIRGTLTVSQYIRLSETCGEVDMGGIHHREYFGYETQYYIDRNILWKFIESGDHERTRAVWKQPTYIPYFNPLKYPLLNSMMELK